MNVLLVQTGFLGDVILSTPVIANLRELYPTAAITVLTTPRAAPLLEHHPAVSSVLKFDKRGAQRGLRGFIEMARQLRSLRFDIVFSLHKSWRTALLLAAARIPTRYGFTEARGSVLYSRVSPRSDLAHDVLRNLAIFRNLDLDPNALRQELAIAVPDETHTRVRELLGPRRPLIGIAPGSVWLTKRWLPEGFAAVAGHFARTGAQVVLIGGPEDQPVSRQVATAARAPLLDLTGKLTVLESAALIAQLDILLTNDSAPLHLASAAGVATIALFCATTPALGFGPWRTRSCSVGVDDLSCRPCGRHGGNSCPTGTHACRLQISPKRVIEAVESFLPRDELARSSR